MNTVANKWIINGAYTTVSIALVVWMITVGILVMKIAENTEYLALGSDYQIELLDQIAGNVLPMSQLKGLGYTRSFSCSIDTGRTLEL